METIKKKHALVVFTKYPEPGVTKTRLIQENGGNLTAAEAAELYKAMVLDTATVAINALEKCSRSWGDFTFCVSSSPTERLPMVKEMFAEAFPSEKIKYIIDKGSCFDEHFNSCYQQLFTLGYHSVVCVGGDMPALTPDLLLRSFKWLRELEKDSNAGAMVLAPCQAGGVSLVGVTKNTDISFKGVFYNPDGITALDALIDIASKKNIPTALFEALADVDYIEDLGHMISVANATAFAAKFHKELVVPQRFLQFVKKCGLSASAEPNESRDPRELMDGH